MLLITITIWIVNIIRVKNSEKRVSGRLKNEFLQILKRVSAKNRVSRLSGKSSFGQNVKKAWYVLLLDLMQVF